VAALIPAPNHNCATHGAEGLNDKLRQIAAFDAVMLSAWDPLDRAQRPLLSTGYGASLLRFLNTG
jgi:hypothetical protein